MLNKVEKYSNVINYEYAIWCKHRHIRVFTYVQSMCEHALTIQKCIDTE